MTDIHSNILKASTLLAETSGSALLDAEVILCHVLNKPRSHLRAWPENNLSTEQQTQFSALISQRMQGTPVAYLTETREFWSRDFKVSPDVLIPRPDTELLIELSLELLNNKPKARIIDLGTGSGIIAITLAAERPDIDVIASDISPQAIAIAKQNASFLKTPLVQFIQSSWFNSIPDSKFELIISNPPYIASNDIHLSQGDVRFEPIGALVADDSGLKDIKNIVDNARHYLTQNGTLLIEHGFDQQEAVQAIFTQFNYCQVQTHPDLSGNPRVTTAQWNAQ
jgi:release factor glutamine methyltransferase